MLLLMRVVFKSRKTDPSVPCLDVFTWATKWLHSSAILILAKKRIGFP